MKLELSTKVSLYTYMHNLKKSPQTQFFCESILYYCVTGFICTAPVTQFHAVESLSRMTEHLKNTDVERL